MQFQAYRSLRRAAWLSTLLLVVVVAAPAGTDSRGFKSTFSDDDRREIARWLLERDLADRPLEPGEIRYYSPRMQPDWISEFSAGQFVQLSFEVESEAADYYDLAGFDVRRGYVQAALVRGPYCEQRGTQYRFTGGTGQWDGRECGFVVTHPFNSKCGEYPRSTPD